MRKPTAKGKAHPTRYSGDGPSEQWIRADGIPAAKERDICLIVSSPLTRNKTQAITPISGGAKSTVVAA
jgi:hypothetical protein